MSGFLRNNPECRTLHSHPTVLVTAGTFASKNFGDESPLGRAEPTASSKECSYGMLYSKSIAHAAYGPRHVTARINGVYSILFPYSAVKTSSVSPPPQTRWITGEWKSWSREKFYPSFLKTTPFYSFPLASSFLHHLCYTLVLKGGLQDRKGIERSFCNPAQIPKAKGILHSPPSLHCRDLPLSQKLICAISYRNPYFFFEQAYIEYNTIEFNRVFVCALQTSLLAFPNLHPPSGPELSNPQYPVIANQRMKRWRTWYIAVFFFPCR